MKKLFFTAIALVAFSGVSMANTIEVKELVIQTEEFSPGEGSPVRPDLRCAFVSFGVMMRAYSAGLFTDEEVSVMAGIAYNVCMTYGK